MGASRDTAWHLRLCVTFCPGPLGKRGQSEPGTKGWYHPSVGAAVEGSVFPPSLVRGAQEWVLNTRLGQGAGGRPCGPASQEGLGGRREGMELLSSREVQILMEENGWEWEEQQTARGPCTGGAQGPWTGGATVTFPSSALRVGEQCALTRAPGGRACCQSHCDGITLGISPYSPGAVRVYPGVRSPVLHGLDRAERREPRPHLWG